MVNHSTEFPIGIEPATNLIQAKRLDIVVKARFFEALNNGRFIEQAGSVYRKHILERTGGREPDDFRGPPSAKRHIDDYVAGCQELLTSMKLHGYDPSAPVPVSKLNIPLNGAHRIACAAALGMNMHVQHYVEYEGLAWDMAWFVHHGFSKAERLRILFDLVRLAPEKCSVFVLWPHVIDTWNESTQSIRNHGYDMAGYVDLAWSEAERPAYESLIYDLYSYGVTDFVGGFAGIDRKIDFLKEKPCFLRVGVCMQRQDGPSLFPGVSALKSSIRMEQADRVPVENFVTCHFSDTPEESMHAARTVLLPENLQSARHRKAAKPRIDFLQWLNQYRKTLMDLDVSPEDCCIVGSASLEIHGVRLSTDIDFTTRSAIRAARFGPGVMHFADGIDLVSEGYHKSQHATPWSDDALIEESALHVYFRGFKIADLAIIKDRKLYSKRPKDMLDVELLEPMQFGHSAF